MKKACILAVFCVFSALPASATTRYVSQSGGTFSGGSACNGQPAISVATFNSTTNAPGDLDYLCGTITSQIIPIGAGANGNPVHILADSGAKVAMPVLTASGAIQEHQNYYKIDGGGGNCGWTPSGGVSTCAVGIIQGTANGTGLANKAQSEAINVDGTTGVEITGWLVENVYVHTSGTDDMSALGPPGLWAIHAYSFPVNLSVHNNTIHDCGWCLDGGGPGFQFYNNEVYNMDHGIGMGGPITGSGSGFCSAICVHHNYFHDMVAWDGSSFHHDGWHVFTDSGAITGSGTCPIAFYNNLVGGDVGNDETSPGYMEASSGALNPYCRFNNVYYIAAGPGSNGRNSCCGVVNGYNDGGSGSGNMAVNETIYGPGGFATSINGTMILVAGSQSSFRLQNILTAATGGPTTQNEIGVNNGATFTSGGLSNNAYVQMSSNTNAFNWKGTRQGSFSTWVSQSGDTNSLNPTIALINLNASGAPQLGSAVCSKGANLTSLGISQLDVDFYGNARPASGAWDIGAIQCSASVTPPPTGQPIMIMGSLPAGTEGAAYDSSLIASGGTPPYTWSVIPNPPVPGLALDSSSGLISGTPAASGSFAVSFSVGDSANDTPATDAVTLTVNAAPTPPAPAPSPYVIFASPKAVSLSARAGGSTTCQAVTIDDTTPSGPLPIDIAWDQPWLSFSPIVGHTKLTGSVCAAPQTTPGTYTGHVIVSATGPNTSGQSVGNSPLSIPVTYTVSQAVSVSCTSGAIPACAIHGLSVGQTVKVTISDPNSGAVLASTETTQ